MFVRIKKRCLKYDVAIDILLLESFRDDLGKSKHRFIKQFTKRQSELNTNDRKKWFLEDIEYDLQYVVFDPGEIQKILHSIRKLL